MVGGLVGCFRDGAMIRNDRQVVLILREQGGYGGIAMDRDDFHQGHSQTS